MKNVLFNHRSGVIDLDFSKLELLKRNVEDTVSELNDAMNTNYRYFFGMLWIQLLQFILKFFHNEKMKIIVHRPAVNEKLISSKNQTVVIKTSSSKNPNAPKATISRSNLSVDKGCQDDESNII